MVAPEVLGCTSMAYSVCAGARGLVVTRAGSTGGSGVGSCGATLGEGRGDNTRGPGEVGVCVGGIAKPPGEGAGRLGALPVVVAAARCNDPAPMQLTSLAIVIFSG
jgi:hypothetical protein